ncbi:methyl-CpG-binding domain protein 2-like isoform X1 [Huso huso]|uniref:Methyl-CpG-binding domain protein 2-like isoform X1 n=1 Tax=Huso huso TaxID=61971 RepID=A0ABR1A0A9_HUSHU
MVQCFAPDCNHQSERETCKFFRFPKDPRLLRIWRERCRRQDKESNQHSRLCSCHFAEGNKVNGPSLFKRNASKLFIYKSPERKKAKMKVLAAVITESTTSTDAAEHAQPLTSEPKFPQESETFILSCKNDTLKEEC